jgi:hypothetical protein
MHLTDQICSRSLGCMPEQVRYKFKTFREEIAQDLDKKKMCLPDLSDTSHLRIDNHDFDPIRCTWQEAEDVFDLETDLLERLEQSKNFHDEFMLVSDELYEDVDQPLRGLDFGIASVVLSLAAMKCFPIYSCNGGCFGEFHHAKYPTVVFYAAPRHAETLLNAARNSGVGIGHSDTGGIIVWANDIHHMHQFARELMTGRTKSRRRTKAAEIKSATT